MLSRRWISVGLALVGAIAGIAAEIVSDAALAASVADLATGWTLLGCGLWGWRQRPAELRWPLLALAGISWFAGNFAASESAAVASAGAALVYVHRGLLVHALVADAGSGRRLVALLATAGYVDGLVTGSLDGPLTTALAVALAACAARTWAGSGALAARPLRLTAAAELALAAGLLLAGVTALAQISTAGADATLYGYEIALVIAGLVLAAVPASQSRAHDALADLVVEVGPRRRSPAVRDALARALGDPSLQVGYWLAGAKRFADRDGRPVELPRDDPGRAATMVEREGERIAVLVHDAAVLSDPAVLETVREATALVLAGARLEAEVGTQLGELRASRQRIVAARDEQRRRLGQRLQDGAERRLDAVAVAVAQARGHAGSDPEAGDLLDLIDSELAHARAELHELARGIHPRVLTERGLAAALSSLAARSTVAVEVCAPPQRLPAPIESAAYFVCSEALTNTAKYAHASRVRCEITRSDGRIGIVVDDDGIGGADPARGSGLRGLADRIDALGGTFAVTSPPGRGTRVSAELPLDGQR